MLVLYRNFDDGKKMIAGELAYSAKDIADFVKANQYPLVQEFDREAAERIFGSEMSSIFYFQDDDADTPNL